MRKVLALALSLGFCIFSASSLKAQQQCFYPASFFPMLNILKLPCVYVSPDACYFAYLGLELEENDRVGLVLISLNATDISPEQFSDKSLLPYYDADNGTVVIPALVYLGKTYKVVLKPRWFNLNLYFDVVNVLPVPDAPQPVCIPSVSNSDLNANFYPNVYSYKLLEKGELKLCYEFEGSPQFISVAASAPPVMLTGDDIVTTGQYAPCPPGYLLGCYMIDEDGNWYAMYKYKEIDSPLGYMVLFCPKEKGYHMIIP